MNSVNEDIALTLEDIKLRIFVDTNILIDCFVTPDESTLDYLEMAAVNSNIELVTSDYALWEKNEFVRKQTWLKFLLQNKRSFNEALNYRISLSDELRANVKEALEEVTILREKFNIHNYNLMDAGTSSGDFFDKLVLLTTYSNISNQDLLIILSAYVTKSKGILTKDQRFNTGFTELAKLEETLPTAAIPQPLKEISFLKLNESIEEHYETWFNKHIKPNSIGKCIKAYPKQNVICIECIPGREVFLGDYLLLLKFNRDHKVKKEVFKITENNLRDYDSGNILTNGTKVCIKVDNLIQIDNHLENAYIFIVMDGEI